MGWISWFIKTLRGFLDLRSRKRTKAAKKAEQQRLANESKKRILEDDIENDVKNVPEPDLDSSEDSEDPLGTKRWNRGHRD